jgi:FkbM family methyltransferase
VFAKREDIVCSISPRLRRPVAGSCGRADKGTLLMRTSEIVCQIREHTLLKRDLDCHSIVIDLGMNDGRFAREIHDKYGCRVIGVEPNPRLAMSFAGSDIITCHNMAISSSEGIVKFRIDDDSEASHIISDDAVTQGQTVVDVPSVSLRTFLVRNDIARVDLLKMDIEGAELAIFEGDDFNVLPQMKQISVEFHAFLDVSQRPRVKEIIYRMTKNGFYCVDFSATWKDVLFLNQAMMPLSRRDKIALSYRKYALGFPALFEKIHREGLGAVTRKIISRRYASAAAGGRGRTPR